MSSAVTGKGVPVKVPNRSIRLSVLRLVRMAVAFVVVAGSLGLATVTATAQDGGSSCPSDGADNYSDVVEGSTHADNIACLRELGISEAGDTYRPGEDMTCSEMAAFMANAYQALTGEEAPIADHEFTDIADDPNADDIARISPNGLAITKGTTDTTYSPNDPVIRGHMALFLTRLYKAVAGTDAPTGDTEFTDIGERSEEQQTAIGQLFALEVTTGTTDTTYSPTDNVTREQMGSFVARMYRALDAIPDPPDPAEAPGAPTGVEVAVSGDDGDALDVSWTAPEDSGTSDVTSYVVQWKSGDDDYSEDNQSSADDASATVAGLTKGATYTIRVAAMSGDGQSDWSDETSALIPEDPGVPTGVAVAISGDAGDALDVSWTAPEDSGTSDVTGYVVQWKSGDDDYSEDNQSSAEDTSASFDDLTQGDTYTFRVAAVSDDGQSDWSDEASGNPGIVPGAVGNLRVTPGNKTLSVTWDAPDDGGSPITGYTIEWRSGRESSETAQAAGSALGYTITLKNNVGRYTVSVTPTNAVGNGPVASVSPGTTTTPTPVASSAPQNLALSQDLAGTTVTASWTPPSDTGGRDVVNYVVQSRSTNRADGVTTDWSTATDVILPTPLTLVVSTTITSSLGNALEVRVRADNTVADDDPDTGLGEWANATITPATAPAAPATPTLNAAHKSIQVTWVPPADNGSEITGYKVSHSSGGAATEASVGADATMHTITGLQNGFQYSVTVKAVNAKGDSDASTASPGTPIPVPAAPRNIRAVVPPQFMADGETLDNDGMSLDVSWDAPAANDTRPVTGYVVQYQTSAIPGPGATCPTGAGSTGAAATADGGCSAGTPTAGPTVSPAEVATRTVTIPSLTNGVSYDVLVQAQNDHDDDTNTAVASGPVAVGTGTPANVPGAVEFLEVEPGYRLLTVRWVHIAANGSDVTHYLLRYAENTDGNEPWSNNIRIAAPRNVHVLSGLKGDTAYIVQVRAVNGIGTGPNYDADTNNNSPDPTTDNVEASTAGIPSAPRNVTAVPMKDGNGSTLTISWSKVTASNGGGVLNGYKVQTQRVSGNDIQTTWQDATLNCDDPATTEVAEACDQNTTSVDVEVDSGSSNVGDTYLVRVRATAGASTDGSNGYAAPVMSAAVPGAPASLAAAFDATTRAVNVTWTGLTGDAAKTVSSYKIRWYPSVAGATGSIGSATITDNEAGEYKITGLTPGSYSVAIVAVNAIGNSDETVLGTAVVVTPVPRQG